MKVYHVSWRLANISLKVEVLTTSVWEEEKVVRTAIRTLSSQGIVVNSIGEPDIKVVYSGNPTVDFPPL